jgi:hypothetical protein
MPNNASKQMNDHESIVSIDPLALASTIKQQGENFYHSISERHDHLFATSAVVISPEQFTRMEQVIAAVEEVVNLPAWNGLLNSPNSAKGVFFGYDFHINENGVHLIEINTNAGGAFLNALLLKSQHELSFPGKSTAINNLEQNIVEMFHNEWRLSRGDEPLINIAIVDETPKEQYLFPEFILAQNLFVNSSINAAIADPANFELRQDGLYLYDKKIDLIYNRLTDFSLGNYPEILEAYQKKHVVLTPNPEIYTRYADKQNLARLTDATYLKSINVSEQNIEVLQKGIPQTKLVIAKDADRWWAERKLWFFKPVSGYGAKGAYRGEKITKRVFEDILSGEYVAQKMEMPGESLVTRNGESEVLKYDVRCYVYEGKVQLIAARMYQGQTTNFRTPGGGFALVRIMSSVL